MPLFDLFVFYHPGIERHHRQWMESPLPLIWKTAKPIMATSCHLEEYAMEVKSLEAYGNSVEGEPLENPFSLQHSGDINGVSFWGRLLYKITSVLPPSDHVVNTAVFDILNRDGRRNRKT
jgi:hypothetical protein